MPRQPKPWFWEARKAWYVQINGKQVKLGATKKDADREFYRIMAAQGSLDLKQSERMTVNDACEALIAQSQRFRESTKNHYEMRLGLFASVFGPRRLTDVRPEEVIQWLSNHEGTARMPFGDPSRSLTFRYVKTLYKWARDIGYIQINQFARIDNPWKVQARDRPMTEEEYISVMTRPRVSQEFKEVLEFIWRTGIRPGELSILSARHLDSLLPIARFQPTEHKTGTRTGLQREVYFPEDLWERLKKYALERQQGPLLRRRNGTPWTSEAITIYFCHIKRSMKLKCTLYQARHAFLTRLGENGVPTHRIAKIAGHRRLDTFLTTYYHPESAKMADDVNSSPNDLTDKIAERERQIKEERLKRERQQKAEYQRRYMKRKREEKEQGEANGPASSDT